MIPYDLSGSMPHAVYHFGDFELDVARFELRQNDRAVKLERIPLELLILLAENGGNLVSRPEIVQRLWGKDVFVDTEHGINTAVRKIRVALEEHSERPRFLFTVPGKGYRLLVDSVPRSAATIAEPAEDALQRPVVRSRVIPGARAAALIVAVVVIGALVGVLTWVRPPASRPAKLGGCAGRRRSR